MAFNGLIPIQSLVNQIGIVWHVIFCAAFCSAEQIFFTRTEESFIHRWKSVTSTCNAASRRLILTSSAKCRKTDQLKRGIPK